MAFAGKIRLTQAGLVLLAAAQTGGSLRFTRYAMGDGVLQNENDMPLSVVSPRAYVPVLSRTFTGLGQVVLTGRFQNTSIQDDFVWREFGLYATGGTEAEQILYAYGYMENGETIKAGPVAGLVEKIIRYTAKIDNAENVTVVVDGTVVGITQEQLNSAIHGMMYSVAEQVVQVGPEGWEQGEDMLFRKFAPVQYMTMTRGAVAQIADAWIGKIALVNVLQKDGGIELISKIAYGFAFELKIFIFDVFENKAVMGL